MIVDKSIFSDMINSPVRMLRGRVEIFEGSTLALICGCHDNLKSFTVERVGESGKFFGFGVCQRLNVHLLDPKRQINVTTAHNLEVEFGVGSDYIYPCPNFFVTEVNRDEETNELSITAYDAIYAATEHTVAELDLPVDYTIREFAEACAALLGLPLKPMDYSNLDTVYLGGANFDGTESIREALDAIAGATQTIYYIDKDWELTFKRLDVDGDPVLVIDKEKYIELESGENRRLTTIAHVTELGNNVSATTGLTGSTQYVRDNPFWEMRDDVGTLVDDALAAVGNTTINQFSCNWRGNFLLEIGDKIGLTTKDDKTVISYVLDDTFDFNGSLSGKTQWEYAEEEAETDTNSSSLGDTLKKTYAKVDKVNKQIELVASETKANTEALASLQINTDSIINSVKKIETSTETLKQEIDNQVVSLTSEVTTRLESDAFEIEVIKTQLNEDTTEVVTTTGYRFDDVGLTVSKSTSDLSTTITEDGMAINRDDEAMLVANHTGVDAMNLHATTYLFVGENSRFQDYGDGRTGCFWMKR